MIAFWQLLIKNQQMYFQSLLNVTWPFVHNSPSLSMFVAEGLNYEMMFCKVLFVEPKLFTL